MGNAPLRHSKSAAGEYSLCKCQKGYRAAEDMSGTFLVPRKQINCNSSKMFCIEHRNCQSQSKNFIKRWYEKLKRTVNVHHRKGAGRPSVSDEVVERVRETFTP
ncbi:hypothetical protein AVEN_92483-1 [Araneus ventricosus]|uniref:DUF4817 domain-containing protein n=1 Tax=Araneus ventricosus TaxID=182803 RepID=A0A4Y2AJY9_ARAVE|nr:hypothetical protein AVEN_92483-1 [Araneus ventricosus]